MSDPPARGPQGVADDRVAAMLLRDVPLGVFAVDAQLRFVWCNEATARLTGTNRELLLGRYVHEYIHPDDLEMVATSIASLDQGRPMLPTLFRVIGDDGVVRRVLGRVQAHNPNADDLLFVATLMDATSTLIDDVIDATLQSDLPAAMHNLVRLIESEANFRASIHWNPTEHGFADVASSGPDIAVLASDDRVVPIIRASLGGAPASATFSSLGIETERTDRRSFHTVPIGLGQDLGVLVGWLYHDEAPTLAGQRFFERFAKFASIALGRDGSDRRLQIAATTDPLTGLWNRAWLRHRIEHEGSTPQSCTLFLLDLDGFKLVNDAHGHYAGDHVLIEVADRLRQLCAVGLGLPGPARSASAARLGGDEFAVVVEGELDPSAQLQWVASMRTAVSAPIEGFESAPDLTFQVGVSIGVASSDSRSGLSEILAIADHAMYAEKRARNPRPPGGSPPDGSTRESRVTMRE